MKPKQLFGVILRAMGVWWLGDALVEAGSVIFKLNGVPTGSQQTWQFTFMFCAANALVGMIMFFGADDIVRLAYRDNHDDEADRF